MTRYVINYLVSRERIIYELYRAYKMSQKATLFLNQHMLLNIKYLGGGTSIIFFISQKPRLIIVACWMWLLTIMSLWLKVWDGAGSGRCLQTYSTHCGAVRDACWLPCGRRLLSGSFDNTTSVTDLETSK